jgi:hypothetical protein
LEVAPVDENVVRYEIEIVKPLPII